MNTLEFSLHPGNKGNVFETEFITSQNNFLNYNINIWDFGDGTTLYNSPTSSHIYQFPGVYRISLSAWSEQGYFLMAEDYINVDYIFRDGITFTNIPEENSIVGIPTSESFVVSVTSCRINEPISITLHALNTNSLPEHKIKEKWQHLAPNGNL
jgi:PKD repeat protein